MGNSADNMDDWFDDEDIEVCEKHQCKYNPKWPCPICEDEWGNNEDYIRPIDELDII